MFAMNRAWQKVEELQQSWVARERELVGQIDQLEEKVAEGEKTIEEAAKNFKETELERDC